MARLKTAGRRAVAGALVLAGSASRRSELEALDRWPFELPSGPGQTVGDRVLSWLGGCAGWGGDGAGAGGGGGDLPVRVLAPEAVGSGVVPSGPRGVSVSLVRDRGPYRGTAGVIRDAAEGFDDDDLLLVVHGSELVRQEATYLVNAMLGTRGDMVVARDGVGRPLGVYLFRAAVLREIPAAGYTDLKEQAFPQLAARHRVSVATVGGGSGQGLVIRSRLGYLEAVAWSMGGEAGWERWRARTSEAGGAEAGFRVVEAGADVASDAVVHDSVVLAGAKVGSGAVVARSVIGAGAVVPSGARVVDAVVGSRRGRSGGRGGWSNGVRSG